MSAGFLLALLVRLSAAEPGWPPELRWEAAAPAPPVPRAAAAAREPFPPEDLSRAAATWGNAAQASRLPPLPAGSSFSVAVIGDGERGRFPWERVFSPGGNTFVEQLRSIHRAGPGLIVQLGDFVSKGDARNYREYIALLGREVRLPMLTVVGNHDRSRPNGAADKVLYRTVFGDPDFQVDVGDWRLVALDSSDRRVRADQLAWLDRVLDTQRRKAVFTHIPPAYLKGRLKSVVAAGVLEDFLTAYFKEGSPEFQEIVERREVSRVYMGHIHAFGLAEVRGVRYVLTGGGGSPLYPLPPGYPSRRMAHFILAAFGPSGVAETVHAFDGRVFPIP